MDRSTPLSWRKSTRSGQSDNCVEVAQLPGGGRAVRDSKNPGGPMLDLGRDAWQAFIDQIKDSRLG